MSKAKTPKQALIAAKWILENKGWCQGVWGKTNDGRPLGMGECHPDLDCACISGAIILVECDPFVYEQMRQCIKNEIPNLDVDSLVRWNDDRKRTKRQVLDMFDQAIAKAPNE